MHRLGILEKDLKETFVRSQGPGGQHANKTSTCVQLKHLPTGIQVKCDRERSQGINRFLARRILAETLENRLLGAASPSEIERAKIRKQKQRRKRRNRGKSLS